MILKEILLFNQKVSVEGKSVKDFFILHDFELNKMLENSSFLVIKKSPRMKELLFPIQGVGT